MKTKTELMYATMAPWRLFFKVALPGMVSMFAMSIYNVFEGAFVGKLLGEAAFAAVNISFPLVLINFSLADLVGVGSSAPISIALGRKDYKTANNVFSCALILILMASVFMGSIMFFAAAPLARMMGANDVLLETCIRYIRTFAICSPLTTVFFAMDNYLRISGYVKYSMVLNLVCNFGTIALMALFFLVFKMDVVGSALAVCICMCVSSLVALIPFVRKKAILQFAKPKFSWALVKQIAACGSPTFLSTVASRVTSILVNISLMRLGTEMLGEGGGVTAVAAFAVICYSADMCWPLIYGISDSLSPALGYNWGAQNYDRVKKISRCGYVGTAVAAIVTTSVLFFFPRSVASFFVDSGDVALMTLAVRGIRIFCTTYLFRWVVMMTQSYLSAIEKPAQATMISLSVAIVFPVLILGALWNLGLDCIWLLHPCVNFLAMILAVVLLMRLLKEIKRRESEKE